MIEIKSGTLIKFNYRDKNGETWIRRAIVKCLYYGDVGWELEVWDLVRGGVVVYAMRDMSNVQLSEGVR